MVKEKQEGGGVFCPPGKIGLRDEPFNIYRGEGTCFETMHAICLRGPLYANNFFLDVTVSKQFFPGKFLG